MNYVPFARQYGVRYRRRSKRNLICIQVKSARSEDLEPVKFDYTVRMHSVSFVQKTISMS